MEKKVADTLIQQQPDTTNQASIQDAIDNLVNHIVGLLEERRAHIKSMLSEYSEPYPEQWWEKKKRLAQGGEIDGTYGAE